MLLIELLVEYSTHSLNRPFSYIYQGSKLVRPGYRVLINFNHRELVGYVINVIETEKTREQLEEELGFTIDEISDVLDETPLLNDDLLSRFDNVTLKTFKKANCIDEKSLNKSKIKDFFKSIQTILHNFIINNNN